MPLPVSAPPVAVACPLRDTVYASFAGDSAGARVNTEGHMLVAIATGVVGGISGLISLAGSGKAAGIFAASTAGAVANVAMAKSNTGVFVKDAATIADCDPALKAAYRRAYGEQAKRRRARSAFKTALASFVTTVVVATGLVLLALSQGAGWGT